MNECCPECDGTGYVYVPCFTCNEEMDDPQPRDLMVEIENIDLDWDLDWDWASDYAQ